MNSFPLQQQKSSHLSSARSNKNEREIDNGFSLIKERLRRAEKRITFIKAGQKLADQLVKENAVKVLYIDLGFAQACIASYLN